MRKDDWLDMTKWDDEELKVVHKSFARAKGFNQRMKDLFDRSSKEMKRRGLK